jgi:hypothetical protein
MASNSKGSTRRKTGPSGSIKACSGSLSTHGCFTLAIVENRCPCYTVHFTRQSPQTSLTTTLTPSVFVPEPPRALLSTCRLFQVSAPCNADQEEKEGQGGKVTTYRAQKDCSVCHIRMTKVCSTCREEWGGDVYVCDSSKGRVCFSSHMRSMHS